MNEEQGWGRGLLVRAGLATDVGRVRDHNEDDAAVEGTVFVVADGLGGHAAGEVASAIAVQTVRELAGRSGLGPDDVVARLRVANERILDSAHRHPERRGMGTTATGLVAVTADGEDRWAVFNLGDSRTYRFAGGRLTLLTTDHSEVQELVDAGLLTPEEAARHPLRNIVTRTLGTDSHPRPDVWVRPPEAGERFVVCSDGLTGELTDAQIEQLLATHDDPQEAAEALVAAAVAAGGHDNVTVVVVAVDRAAG